ncbi:MAG TPA: hypothetical protein VK477_09550, partial [Acidobacteriota bacterium]|nr:hypothetical protein [Acidobacteriota bacterium]
VGVDGVLGVLGVVGVGVDGVAGVLGADEPPELLFEAEELEPPPPQAVSPSATARAAIVASCFMRRGRYQAARSPFIRARLEIP